MPRSNSYFIGEAKLVNPKREVDPNNTFMFYLTNKEGMLDLWEWKYHLENSINTPRKKQKALRKLRALLEIKFSGSFGMWY